jgi:NAD(P)-dependent dehydrogenase (short-subunit alcohol dehydrogenase family)
LGPKSSSRGSLAGGSLAGKRVGSNVGYAMTKFAVVALTHGIRREARAAGIRATRGVSHDNDLRAFRDSVIEINHVLIQHADAAGRYGLPDAPWFRRPVNPIERVPAIFEEI